MSLANDLAELERQRREEVRTLHCTYLRTKREVKRAASPTRIARRHMGVSLAAAAALGMILAPRPGPKKESPNTAEHKGGPKRRGISAGWMKTVLAKYFPQAAEFIPGNSSPAPSNEVADNEDAEARHEQDAAKEAKTKKEKGMLWRLVETLAPMLMSKIDWRAMINQVMHEFNKKVQDGSNNGKKHEPHVSVADAGTVKPQDFENFQ